MVLPIAHFVPGVLPPVARSGLVGAQHPGKMPGAIAFFVELLGWHGLIMIPSQNPILLRVQSDLALAVTFPLA